MFFSSRCISICCRIVPVEAILLLFLRFLFVLIVTLVSWLVFVIRQPFVRLLLFIRSRFLRVLIGFLDGGFYHCVCCGSFHFILMYFFLLGFFEVGLVWIWILCLRLRYCFVLNKDETYFRKSFLLSMDASEMNLCHF